MKINMNTILLMCIAINPIFDIIFTITTQILKLDLSIDINQLFRGFVLIIFLIYIRNFKTYLKLFSIGALLILSLYIQYKLGFVLSFISNISFLLKVFTGFVFYYAFQRIFIEERISKNSLFNSVGIASIIISITILLGWIGIGNTTYYNGEVVGVKGLFNSQNAVTGSLMMMLPMNYIFIKGNKKYIYTGLVIIGLFSIRTKASIISIIAFIVLISLFYFKEKVKKVGQIKFKKITIICSLICMLFLPIGIYWIMNYINALISTAISYNYESFYSFLVSNRNLQLDYVKEFISTELTEIERIYVPIVGLGYSLVEIVLKNRFSSFSAIEQDFIGLYYYVGIIITIIVIVTIIINVYKIFKICKKDLSLEHYAILIAFAFGILQSILGGHILYEALASLFFWLIMGYISSEYKKIKIGEE